jgi:hypothetical protein
MSDGAKLHGNCSLPPDPPRDTYPFVPDWAHKRRQRAYSMLIRAYLRLVRWAKRGTDRAIAQEAAANQVTRIGLDAGLDD